MHTVYEQAASINERHNKCGQLNQLLSTVTPKAVCRLCNKKERESGQAKWSVCSTTAGTKALTNCCCSCSWTDFTNEQQAQLVNAFAPAPKLTSFITPPNEAVVRLDHKTTGLFHYFLLQWCLSCLILNLLKSIKQRKNRFLCLETVMTAEKSV